MNTKSLRIQLFVLLLFLSPLLIGQEQSKELLTNALLPGSAQRVQGDTLWFTYTLSLPLLAGGLYLSSTQEGYLNFQDISGPSGQLLTSTGASLYFYSLWQANRYFSNLENEQTSLPTETYTDILFAPFKLKNLLNYEVFPFLFYGLSNYLDYERAADLNSYFQLEQVKLFGDSYSPEEALIYYALFTGSVNLFTASWEELVFRGLWLDEIGIHSSAIAFGGFHLLNLLTYDSIDESVLFRHISQSLSMTVFGYYLGHLTQKYDSMEKAITIHYWNNMAAFLFNFMLDSVNPDRSAKAGYLSFSIPLLEISY